MNLYVNPEILDRQDRTVEFGLFGDSTNPGSDVSFTTYHSGLPLQWQGTAPRTDTAASSSAHFAAKRVLDVVMAAIAVVALAPLLLIVAGIIKASGSGPVLFRQAREGLDGKMFDIYKFRSMRVEACDDTGVKQTVEDDPRLTPFGKFLRRTSIDELPQLFNVLLGDMSLVGPRPHVRGMFSGGVLYKTLVPYYDQRLAMRPGITGWAQANGLRGSTTNPALARARVDHDIAYIRNYSIWLDIKTILRTLRHEFFTGSGN